MIRRLYQPFSSQAVRLSDDQWAELEKIGKILLSPGRRNQLELKMTVYRTSMAMRASAITASTMRPKLQRLTKALHVSATAINDAAIARELQKAAGQVDSTPELIALIKNLSRWKKITDAALEALPTGKTPKEGDPHVRKLIDASVSIFHAAGGKGKASSTSKAFVRKVCSLSGYVGQSRTGTWNEQRDDALRKLIERSLGTLGK